VYLVLQEFTTIFEDFCRYRVIRPGALLFLRALMALAVSCWAIDDVVISRSGCDGGGWFVVLVPLLLLFSRVSK
jgi:hypothetical protein